MTYAISSDIALIDRNGDTFIDRGYVGDTGGNVWRIDIGHPDPSNWAVNKLASVGYAAGGGDTHRRKFLYPPDVVYTNDSSGAFDAVLIGSGDREHPLQGNGDIDHPVANAVVNRYYMFEDASTGSTFSGAGSGASGAILESDLDDVTSNIDGTQGLSRLGWFITLGTAEKVISSSLTLAGATFFNTHQPTSPAAGSCTSLGQARLYSVNYRNGAAAYDRNADGILNGTDRFYAGSSGALTGLAPSPVAAIIQLNGQYRQVVCNGPHCELAPGAFGARVRTFWQQLFD
jgi:type IV pilus assembly protein PilY1